MGWESFDLFLFPMGWGGAAVVTVEDGFGDEEGCYVHYDEDAEELGWGVWTD
jgi:hypothetical protein